MTKLTKRNEEEKDAGDSAGDDEPLVDFAVADVDLPLLDAVRNVQLRFCRAGRRVDEDDRHQVKAESGERENEAGQQPDESVPGDLPARARRFRGGLLPALAPLRREIHEHDHLPKNEQ